MCDADFISDQAVREFTWTAGYYSLHFTAGKRKPSFSHSRKLPNDHMCHK